MSETTLTLYTVRDAVGNYLPRDNPATLWWASINHARIYTSATPARAMVTRMTQFCPDAGPYDLIALHVTELETLPEKCRVASAVKTIEDRNTESERVARAWRLADAKRDIASARALVRELEENNAIRTEDNQAGR